TILSNAAEQAKPEIKKAVVLDSSYSWKVSALIFVLVIFVTMVYGPIAAFLVELFPTRIRYTSMSLPYHIGNGVFGGLVPFLATAIATKTGNMYAGLFYPMGVAAMTLFVGVFFIRERRNARILDDL